jgi:predicted MPP superfamily phosphohydrolase
MVADATWFEPQHPIVRTFPLAGSRLGKRLVHITDLHFKGDVAYLRRIVAQINELKPEAILFTGDLIETAPFLRPVLDGLRGLHAPIFAVPGNHDDWSRADFAPAHAQFSRTGGGWFRDRQIPLFGGGIVLTCLDRWLATRTLTPVAGALNIVLMHYPAWAEDVLQPYDLLLAGHTHGGQVRAPFYGAFVTPQDSGPYQKGWYDSRGGRLYVNPGLGNFYANVRFNCRPEITVFEV